ncbi:hypothetical protein [Arthrobacter sp. 2MCAF14]|uniref:hypothetical protein n=1 Tax=Arthrobacter sp. 2MCAF14 TaxID=3232982 RepID=UPI003F8F94FC
MSQTKQQAPPASSSAAVEANSRLNMSVLKFACFLLVVVFGFVFGFVQDRPKNVYEREDTNKNSQGNQLVSTIFYSVAALVAVVVLGPLGFIPLALAVVVVARRRCAAKFVPYKLNVLVDNIAEVLEDQRLKYAVLGIMGLTVILHVLRMVTVPVGGFDSVASAAMWALWLFVAFQAAAVNLSAATEKALLYNDFAAIFAKAFGGTTDEWHKAKIDKDGEDIVVTNFPLGAVLKYDGVDEILAKIAPDWELDPESDRHKLTLHPVSHETEARREAETVSGGLIGARVETEQASEPAFAGFSITDDDLR